MSFTPVGPRVRFDRTDFASVARRIANNNTIESIEQNIQQYMKELVDLNIEKAYLRERTNDKARLLRTWKAAKELKETLPSGD